MTYRERTDVHTTAELEAATGFGYRTLRRWVLAGILPAPTRTSAGRGAGVVALWTPDAMRRAVAAAALRRKGYSVAAVKLELDRPPRRRRARRA